MASDMSLARQIRQKIGSIAYQARANQFKHSQEWLSHRHNKHFPKIDWKSVHDGIAAECRQRDIPLEELTVDKEDFNAFARRFRLPSFSLYARRCREKKMMEHYIAFLLMGLTPGNRYIDIASESSPFPDLAREKLGLETYSQDLTYAPGFHGNRIGSSADRLPIDDNWIHGASLQCAFEHFQGDIDSNFIREIARVLKPGGRCVIVPLYMSQKAVNLYDPLLYTNWDDIKADPETEIIAEIALGGHFERFYSPETLQRILISGIGLHYRMYHITGKEAVFPGITPYALEQLNRVRYALAIEKPQR